MTFHPVEFEPSPKLVAQLKALAALGVFALLAGLVFAPERIWPNLLLLSYYLLGLALAGTVFIALQYVTGAHWGIALRRVPEAMAALLPLGGLGILAVLFFQPSIYAWMSHEPTQHEAAFRKFWLELSFFRARAFVFLVTWTLFTWAMLRASRRQDADGDLRHTERNQRLSAGFLVAFAVTFWLASFDWIMSLEPEWYSTIFGLYNFAGLFLAGLAAITVLTIWLKQSGALRGVITEHHLHDLGKLLFSFATFWAYLWFSQYMLIWYANIPEETGYFIHRQHGLWQPLFLLNVALNWAVPFLVLLPRRHKQSPSVLMKVSIVLLLGRWLDLYLMIMPPFAGQKPAIGIWEIALAAGAGALFLLGFIRTLRAAPIVPLNDPYLPDSLHYHS